MRLCHRHPCGRELLNIRDTDWVALVQGMLAAIDLDWKYAGLVVNGHCVGLSVAAARAQAADITIVGWHVRNAHCMSLNAFFSDTSSR